MWPGRVFFVSLFLRKMERKGSMFFTHGCLFSFIRFKGEKGEFEARIRLESASLPLLTCACFFLSFFLSFFAPPEATFIHSVDGETENRAEKQIYLHLLYFNFSKARVLLCALFGSRSLLFRTSAAKKKRIIVVIITTRLRIQSSVTLIPNIYIRINKSASQVRKKTHASHILYLFCP